MPCCDAYIPQNALEPEAERKLVARVTEFLVEHEMRRILDLMHEPAAIDSMRSGRSPLLGPSSIGPKLM